MNYFEAEEKDLPAQKKHKKEKKKHRSSKSKKELSENFSKALPNPFLMTDKDLSVFSTPITSAPGLINLLKCAIVSRCRGQASSCTTRRGRPQKPSGTAVKSPCER